MKKHSSYRQYTESLKLIHRLLMDFSVLEKHATKKIVNSYEKSPVIEVDFTVRITN